MPVKFSDITVSSVMAKVSQDFVPVKVILEQSKTKFEQFFSNQPKILFSCDYIVDEKLIGALFVFRRYSDATHYEIYKRNKFDNNPKFERILFLNNISLDSETTKFLPYLSASGFSFNENNMFIILDDNVKKDRIYEYFVRAALVPEKIEDFSPSEILKSKEMVTVFNPSTQQQLSELLNWTSGLFNVQVSFFENIEPQLSNFENGIFILKDNEKLVKLINDAIYLFGLKKVISHLISLINKKEGQLNKFIKDCFELSIDETAGTFSFEVFKVKLSSKKTFSFENTGSISFNSFENFTKIFETLKNINKLFLEPLPVSDNPQSITSGASPVSFFVSTKE